MHPLAQTPTDSYTSFVLTVTETKTPVDSVSAPNTTLITGVQVMWGVSIHASSYSQRESRVYVMRWRERVT